jgi:hypothetical protein
MIKHLDGSTAGEAEESRRAIRTLIMWLRLDHIKAIRPFIRHKSYDPLARFAQRGTHDDSNREAPKTSDRCPRPLLRVLASNYVPPCSPGPRRSLVMGPMSGSLRTTLRSPTSAEAVFTAARLRGLNRTNHDESRERRGPALFPRSLRNYVPIRVRWPRRHNVLGASVISYVQYRAHADFHC